MASAENPFGGGGGGGGNPFDPMGGGATPVAAAGYGTPSPYGVPPQQSYPPQQGYGMPPQQQGYGMQQQQPQQPPQPPSPAASAPAQDPWSMQPQQQTSYGQQQQQQQQQQQPPQMQQQPPQMHAYQQPPAPAPAANGGYDPFSASPVPVPVPAPPTPTPTNQMMVLAQQQSNPYGGMVAPAPAPPAAPMDYGSQSLVPSVQQQPSPWGMPQQQPQQQQAPGGYGAPQGAASYDPFAPPPAPPPVPMPADPFGDTFSAAPPSQSYPPEPAPAPRAPEETQLVVASQQQQQQQQQMQQYKGPSGGDYNHYQQQQQQQQEQQEQQEQPSERAEDPTSRAIVPANPEDMARRANLARLAPPGASPIPKANLVKKRGYALSRISFRTIVMKKWKQAYWVQYGSHTMLWFRSQGDFEDWLSNPYHTQAQRNFMIKLAVNFVHDLYKPNVRGYQVTQCRVKPYGTKMVRQFKLERWMDYGPTIAAAFGSYDPKEVDALREAIVECMRNTPLDGGIRATGAVRQMPDSHNDPNGSAGGQYSSNSHQQDSNGSHQHQHQHQQYDNEKADMNRGYNSGASAYTQPNPVSAHSQRPPSRSVVSAADLLDDMGGAHNFDDTASLPPSMNGTLVPAHNRAQAYPGAPPQQGDLFGAAPPTPQYQQPSAYPQAAPPSQPAYGQQQYPQQQYEQQQQQQQYQQPQYQQPQHGYQPQQQQQQQQQPSYGAPNAYPVQGQQF